LVNRKHVIEKRKQIKQIEQVTKLWNRVFCRLCWMTFFIRRIFRKEIVFLHSIPKLLHALLLLPSFNDGLYETRLHLYSSDCQSRST